MQIHFGYLSSSAPPQRLRDQPQKKTVNPVRTNIFELPPYCRGACQISNSASIITVCSKCMFKLQQLFVWNVDWNGMPSMNQPNYLSWQSTGQHPRLKQSQAEVQLVINFHLDRKFDQFLPIFLKAPILVPILVRIRIGFATQKIV